MLYLIRFLIDAVYVLALYLGYHFGQVIGMKYMFTDLFFARWYCGFIGVAIVVFVFSKLKGTVIFFVKAVTLYAVATGTSASEAFKGVMHKLTGVLGITAATKLLTEAIDDVQSALMSDNPSEKITEMFPILKSLPFDFVIDVLIKYYAKSFTYLDECILAYAFAMDKPILKSLKDGFVQFVKKAHVIMTKMIVANVAVTVINVVILAVGVIIYVTKFGIGLQSFVIFCIAIRAILYVIDDAFAEPLLMQSVIAEYVDNIPSAADELEKNMSSLVEGAEEQVAPEEAPPEGDSAQIPAELAQLLELPAVKRLMQLSEEMGKKGGKAA